MEKRNSFKDHLNRYGGVYLMVAASSVITGLVVYIAVNKKHVQIQDGNTLIDVRNIFGRNLVDASTTITMSGHPGNIIEDLATGTMYSSQNAAAKALGLSPADLSRHLSGEHVKDGLALVNHGMNLSGKVAT